MARPGRLQRVNAPRGCDRAELAQGGETRQRLRLELPDALARQVELGPDRLERPGPARSRSGARGCAAHARGERRAPRARPGGAATPRPPRTGRLLRGREEIAQLALVVGADRLVQRDRRVGGAQRLVDVLHRQSRCLGQLFLRRLAAQLDLEPARGPRQLLLPLDHAPARESSARGSPRRAAPTDGSTRSRTSKTRTRGASRTSRPRGGAPLPLLDQVEERDAQSAVALGDGDDEP